jgi:hypothetical protein
MLTSRLATVPDRAKLPNDTPILERMGTVKPDYAWLRNNRVITLAAVCAVAGFLIGMLIFGEPWHLPPAWGDIPTWIAAVAAIGAGFIAYRVYWISAEDRRSAQAARVAAWYGLWKHEAVTPNVYTKHPSPAPAWGAFLRNASDLPVYDVHVKFYFPPPGTHDYVETWNIHTVMQQVLPPSDTPIHVPIDEVELRLYSDDPRMDAFHRVQIEFTDTQGIRWHRDVKGRLRRK